MPQTWPVLTLRAAMTVAIAQGMACAQVSPIFDVSPVTGANAVVSRTPRSIVFDAVLLGDLIAFAYGFPFDRVERKPQWMYDQRFNVAVTPPAPVSRPELKLLLQKLLEERFGLVTHRASYASPVYYLTAGPNVKLTPAEETGALNLLEAVGRSVNPPRQASMSDLAAWLYGKLQLPVVDKTGISGFFEIGIAGIPVRGGDEPTIRAVHNSLGLNLERHPGTAESLIIDRATKPGGA